MGGEIEHHTSQEQTDLESDSKGDLQYIVTFEFLGEINTFSIQYQLIVKQK